ncbi:MAG: transcription antitermination factor NusB [Verrucomicrobia bacterium]|nr:transcription antitermination factor NusB [Verrucomicrobiota bacterium]
MSLRRANRVAAMQFLYQWSLNPSEPGNDFALNRALENFFLQQELERDQFSFAEELIRGAIGQMESVDDIIKRYLRNWDFDRIAKVDLAILRLAIFEMSSRQDIPPIVSINEAIDLSKEFSNPDAKRFINGILDQFKLTLARPLRTTH